MPEITKCTNSTVTEAWFVVAGSPYLLGIEDQNETAVVMNTLQKRHAGSKVIPTITLASSEAVTVNPFFRSELLLENKKRVRVGYRFTSGHTMHNQSSKYEGFTKELRPLADETLNDFKHAVIKPENAKVALMAYGYKNEFSIDTAGDLDLSEYFRVAFGIMPEGSRPNLSLTGLNSDFTFFDSASQMRYLFSIRGEQPNPNIKAYIVRVNTVCQLNSNNLTFNDSTEVLNAIDQCRQAARAFFFDLTTDKTKAIMGVG